MLEGFVAAGARSVVVALPGGLVSPAEALAARLPGGLRKALAELAGIPASVRRAHPAMVHLPAFAGRVPRGIPYAVTVHDLAFLADPSWFPRSRSIYYRAHFPAVARGACRIIVDSDFSAREAGRLLGIEPSVIRRVYLSAPSPAKGGRHPGPPPGMPDEYVLFVGTIEPRKNLGALLDAWPTVQAVHPRLRLVVAGRWGWGASSLRRRLSATPGVVWTGPLAAEDLRAAYSGARLLVYPSLYEGFGLPPLEAAAAGVPSVIGPAASLREIYSDVAASICGPDPSSIASAIVSALASEVDAERLREFAGGFDVGMTARETLAVYREITG